MTVTPEIENEILTMYRANPQRFQPFKVARRAGVSVGDVTRIIKGAGEQNPSGGEHSGGEGREDLQPFIVAKRRANARGWDNDDPAVILARQKFIAGTHDMATHRDGPWLFLCLFPLQKPRAPFHPKYFQGVTA